MKKVNSDHYLYVLGKNGEPWPEVKVSLNISHNWFYRVSDSSSKALTLTTDSEGKIKLGSLK
jgi:hypothetical protein